MPASGGQWIIQKDEATAGQRTIVFQLTTSNLTTPLTSAPTSSTSSVYVSINGAAQSVVAAPISTVSANAGLYSVAFPQAGVATLGNYAVYWVGGYSQFLGNVTVVNDNIFSNVSNLASVDYSSKITVGVGIATPSLVTVRLSALDYSSVVTTGVGKIAAATYSGVTVGAGDYAAKDMSSALTVGVGIATPSVVTVRLSAMDYSSVVTVGAGIATPSKLTVQVSANNDKTGYTILAGAYSTVTFDAREVATVLDKAGYTITAGDYSSTVTFGAGTIKPASYSGVTVGVNNVGPQDVSSVFTVGVGIAKPSAVTVQVSANNDKTGYALAAGDFSSSVTVGVGIAAPSKVTVQVSANNDKTGYTLTAGDYSSTVTFGTGTIKAATYSGVTVGAGDYIAKDMSSKLTVGAGIAAPSLVTVQVSANNDKTGYTIAAGAYSTVTFDAREVATVLDKTGYTAATVGDKTGYTVSTVQDKTGYGLAAGTYSGVTVGTNNVGVGAILATSFAAGAIDGIALAQSAAQEVADRTLLRALSTGTDTGRTVQDALRALRNRNDIETGVLTVYQEDDITSAWTATVSTAAGNPINQIDPA